MNIEKKYTPLSTILRYLYPSDICKRWHSIGFILQSYIPSKLAEIKKKNDFHDKICVYCLKQMMFYADALSMNVQVLLYFKLNGPWKSTYQACRIVNFHRLYRLKSSLILNDR